MFWHMKPINSKWLWRFGFVTIKFKTFVRLCTTQCTYIVINKTSW